MSTSMQRWLGILVLIGLAMVAIWGGPAVFDWMTKTQELGDMQSLITLVVLWIVVMIAVVAQIP